MNTREEAVVADAWKVGMRVLVVHGGHGGKRLPGTITKINVVYEHTAYEFTTFIVTTDKPIAGCSCGMHPLFRSIGVLGEHLSSEHAPSQVAP